MGNLDWLLGIVGGLIGGNAAGAAKNSLGTAGNSVAGALGGALGGGLLGNVLGSGGDIAQIAGSVGGGGVVGRHPDRGRWRSHEGPQVSGSPAQHHRHPAFAHPRGAGCRFLQSLISGAPAIASVSG